MKTMVKIKLRKKDHTSLKSRIKSGSKARIESRKGVLSRKSSINKNSFYRNKAIGGKLPDYLPNKPTVVGSRGQNQGAGLYKGPGIGSG